MHQPSFLPFPRVRSVRGVESAACRVLLLLFSNEGRGIPADCDSSSERINIFGSALQPGIFTIHQLPLTPPSSVSIPFSPIMSSTDGPSPCARFRCTFFRLPLCASLPAHMKNSPTTDGVLTGAKPETTPRRARRATRNRRDIIFKALFINKEQGSMQRQCWAGGAAAAGSRTLAPSSLAECVSPAEKL